MDMNGIVSYRVRREQDMQIINDIVAKVFSLSRPTKRIIQVAFDTIAICLCFWLAMALRLDGITTEIGWRPWVAPLTAAPFTVAAFVYLGLYRAVVRYIAGNAIKAITIGVVVSAVAVFVISQLLALGVPRSVPGIYLALLLIVVGGTRFLMRGLYLTAQEGTKTAVVIYGAGETGRQLVRSLQQSQRYRAALFIDDDPKMHGSIVNGIRVVPPSPAEHWIGILDIQIALISIGQKVPAARRKVAQLLADLGLEIRIIPNVTELVSGKARISELPRFSVEELLGRDPVHPVPELMSKTTTNKSVMVTGAGGSIGAELCRQITSQRPKRLVLFESSEFALYSIFEELLQYKKVSGMEQLELIPILGSVTNKNIVCRTIEKFSVGTLFHAAAYKHVPLVETNVTEGVQNNVFGTLTVAEAAAEFGVEFFTLVSTDKAVRPTNVMGATKRIAELIIQTKALEFKNTKFCAVRFGNVLGSSGSVIPKFRKQIEAGGPITITHPDMTRYFMTIPEAAQLVVQASALAASGEILLLDMGKPVKIMNLAKTMARLHGRQAELANPDESNVDISIEIGGLRPGEKLYEELLIGTNAIPTDHPRIMRDPSLHGIESISQGSLDELRRLIEHSDTTSIKQYIQTLDVNFEPTSKTT